MSGSDAMFRPEFAYTLEAAIREAVKRGSSFFCVEHLLFALFYDDNVVEILEGCGGDIEEMQRDLEKFFDQLRTDSPDTINSTTRDPIQTPALRRVLHRAITQVLS